jgi:hypothetical protein
MAIFAHFSTRLNPKLIQDLSNIINLTELLVTQGMVVMKKQS